MRFAVHKSVKVIQLRWHNGGNSFTVVKNILFVNTTLLPEWETIYLSHRPTTFRCSLSQGQKKIHRFINRGLENFSNRMNRLVKEIKFHFTLQKEKIYRSSNSEQMLSEVMNKNIGNGTHGIYQK